MNCIHYDRNCKILAPCCNKFYNCRLCHDEESQLCDKLDRKTISRIKCKKCDTEQDISNKCIKCSIEFGKYFCKICNLFDNNIEKKQYHCVKCGICRVGGKENFYHCDNCNMCISNNLKDNHKCITNSFDNNCPICFDPLFDSIKQVISMKCGHTIHYECFKDLLNTNTLSGVRCPICNKTTIDASVLFNHLENEINLTPMPEELNYNVKILCNDCNIISDTKYHIIGHKCKNCNSFNTVKYN